MHEKFCYDSIEAVRARAQELGCEVPISQSTEILGRKKVIKGLNFENRIVIQPMEGCDGEPDGSPGEYTNRRYKRFAGSGAGLIWFEAVAVVNEGRANKGQLFIHSGNLDAYKRIVEDIKRDCMAEHGFEPVVIMQATHSGRYSKPNGFPEPVIAYNNPLFEKEKPIDSSRIITDEELKNLELKFDKAAILSKEAGFDGIDVKCCHRYLSCELLSAYKRDGEYGGSFENRIRFYTNCIRNANTQASEKFIVTSRLNVYDGFPYPYGFGVAKISDRGASPELTEAKKLVGILHNELGLEMLNVTIGNPYVNPHVNRPYDNGVYVPDEHPLEGLERIIGCAGQIQKAYPQLNVVTSGNSYLREYSVNIAAGALEAGLGSFAGFGREAFAYPRFAADVLERGAIQPGKCCITCGKCALLLRAGSPSGCVVRDSLYAEIFKNAIK